MPKQGDGRIEGPSIKGVTISFSDGRVEEASRYLICAWSPGTGPDVYVWGFEGPEPKHCWTMVSINIAQQFLTFAATPRAGLDPKWLEQLDAYLDSLFLQLLIFKDILPPSILQQVSGIQAARQIIVQGSRR